MKFFELKTGRVLWVLLILLLVNGGCASSRKTDTRNTDWVDAPAGDPAAQLAPTENYQSSYPTVPETMNSSVQMWLNYYQGRGRPYMTKYLERSGRYSALMKSELRKQGLPEELIYVVFVESGFSYSAHSRANAVGYWQFIRETGKRYGLKIDAFVDERQDPVLSTAAAGRYLATLYSMFDDWYLAFAAYNTGENRVQRAVQRTKSKDFWRLRYRLYRETRNYVPKIIAAMMIAKDPKAFGFTDIAWEEPIGFEEVTAFHAVDLKSLSREINVPYEDLKRLNPKFRSEYAPTHQGRVAIRVPLGMAAVATAGLTRSLGTAPRIVASDIFYYRVRRGDTLSGIAHRHRTYVSTIKRLNNLGSRSMIRVGQVLKVPQRYINTREVADSDNKINSSRADQAPVRKSQSTKSQPGSPPLRYHVVRRGENLSRIAAKYGVSLADLKRLNNLKRADIIIPGRKLVVAEHKLHVVKPGETLSHIADRYRVQISTLVSLNEIENRSLLAVGQALVIPQ